MADPASLEIAYSRLRRAQKILEAGREHFARALELRRALVGEEDWEYTFLRAEYAEILTELGRFAEAEKEAQTSYDSLREVYGPRTVMVEEPLRSLPGPSTRSKAGLRKPPASAPRSTTLRPAARQARPLIGRREGSLAKAGKKVCPRRTEKRSFCRLYVFRRR